MFWSNDHKSIGGQVVTNLTISKSGTSKAMGEYDQRPLFIGIHRSLGNDWRVDFAIEKFE